MTMTYTVTAKQYSNSIQFEVFAENIKEALKMAKIQAIENFDAKAGDEVPTVSVKLSKDQGGDQTHIKTLHIVVSQSIYLLIVYHK